MATAIDTNVLVYASSVAKAGDHSDRARKRQDCRAFLRSQAELCISAIAAVEFIPYVTAEEQAGVDTFMEHIDILPFGADAALLATDLIRDARKKSDVCQTCLHPMEAKPCKTCNRLGSRSSKLMDYFIAASAAVAPHVDVLVTYDIRPALVRKLEGKLSFMVPPDASGPLFEQANRDRSSEG